MDIETLLAKSLSNVTCNQNMLIFPKKLTITYSFVLSPTNPSIHYRFDNDWINWLNDNTDVPFEPLQKIHEFLSNEALFPFFLSNKTRDNFTKFSRIYFLNPTIISDFF